MPLDVLPDHKMVAATPAIPSAFKIKNSGQRRKNEHLY